MTMRAKSNQLLLLLLCHIFLSGLAVDALSYDYSYSLECLANPHKPQYGGGIVVNPELDHGLKGWTTFGEAKIEQRVSKGGNKFIVAHQRQQPFDSFSQKFYLEKGKFYTFSAWLQVSEGNAKVAAVFKTPYGFERAGWVGVESGCWSMVKGGLTVNASGSANLYFESKNASVEIWADSISLQPFTEEEWTSHQHQSIEKARKSSVKLIAVDAEGNPIPNAKVSITQIRPNFPFGCAISSQIISNTAYQNWFKSRFTLTTFENELKWASTESTRYREDYSVPDAMLQFTSQNRISVRGHNVLWEDQSYLPGWAKSLSSNDLRSATERRVYSVVSRYAGKLIAWDVINEPLHFNYFESVLGQDASAVFFGRAHKYDGGAALFLNDYNTIEEPNDGAATPYKYLQKIQQIRSLGYSGPLSIGLESHFKNVNLPYIRASIDKLAAAGLPIWLTEVDVTSGPNQAASLEQVLREGQAHPKVQGIVIWSAWKPQGCFRMCLTDNNFRNLPTGDVVDKLIKEWRGGVSGTADDKGQFEARLFHGDYRVTITHPNMNASLVVDRSFKVGEVDGYKKKIVYVKVSA